jgi:D-sedoheptulose 7-phosphate isomerase
MSGTRFVNKELSETLYVMQQLALDSAMHELLAYIAGACSDVIRNGGKVIFAGNGASAATSQQCALLLSHKIYVKRAALASLSLGSDAALITAIAAEEGFDQAFARQLEAVGRPGDLFCVFSPSAEEKNVLLALHKAKRKNMICVGLTGQDGKAMTPLCDALIHVPSSHPTRIREAHATLGMLLVSMAESYYFNEDEFKGDSGAVTDENARENVFGIREAKETKENW